MNFSHSDVLFCGDDGLPLEFNIQNTKSDEKGILRDMIEHGGGLCSDNAVYSDSAVYLVSTGTKVINVGSNKRLISSKYIFDCVRQNYFLDTDDYRIEVNEMETSDFSDNSANLMDNDSSNKDYRKSSNDAVENSVDILDPKNSNLICVNSNHAFDFEETGNQSNIVITNKEFYPKSINMEITLQPHETHIQLGEASVSAVSDSLNLDESVDNGQNMFPDEICDAGAIINVENQNVEAVINVRNSPVSAVIVSSSQPNEGDVDEFDNDVLSRIRERPAEKEEDNLSQSYTVSSSADVVSSKSPSHNTSAEIFDGSPDAPDSASQLTESQEYIRSLEQEVEQILQKPSPKSIEDKIAFVKYICCVRKLAPAKVLQTLQSIRN